MARVQRFDVHPIGEVEHTPQGGIVAPAYLTRTGVFDYEQPDGRTIREYRPPDEVFHADSLATLPHAPVTNTHPREAVDPKNFQKYAVGHVDAASVKQDGDKIAARVVIQEARAIRDVADRRRREVSCGYNCDVDETPGVLPDGTHYDRIQRNIRYNHVAIVEDGRAGPEVRLRLDSRGNQKSRSEEQTTMEKEFEIIGGVRYEVGTPPHADATKRRADARKRRDDAAAKTRKQIDELTARVDSLTAENTQLKAKLTDVTSPQRLDHAVKVRAAVIKRASVALGAEYKADGKSIAAIKLDAVRARFPEIKLDGKSRDYVNALFRTIPKAVAERADSPGGGLHLDDSNTVRGGSVPTHLRQPPPGFKRNDGASKGVTLDEMRARRDSTEEDRHRRPLAVSKSNPHREMDGFPAVQGSMIENMR